MARTYSTRQDAGVSVAAHDPQSVLAAIEGADRFLVQQVFKPIGNEYRISIPASGSTEEGDPLLYVKQKKLKIKEDIRFRLSPDDGPDWLSLLTWLPFNFVLKRDGRQVGTYKRVLGKLRDRYVMELDEGAKGVDRRLLLAFAVALDALQDR